MHLVRHRKGQRAIVEVPPSSGAEFVPGEMTARDIVEKAVARGDSWLNAEDVRNILHCYGIPAPRSALAKSPAEAARIATGFGVPVALKIASPDITHKSDTGGVVLDLQGAEAVLNAAEAMQARLRKAVPSARLAGFLVQEMIRRPGAYELIAGMSVDRQFGPVILFGQGGTGVEVIADTALALPPLNRQLARDLMGETRVFRQLQGYRGRAAADLDAIALTLTQLSQLICDLDPVVELDLNPLLADADGVIAVDARIRVALSPKSDAVRSRLSIRPYPKELERDETIPGMAGIKLRPIRPDDAAGLAELVTRLAPEDARLRFFTPIHSLDSAMLVRFTQIDYDREMAFVLVKDDELLAVARLAADPDGQRAEFAIVVRSDLHRRGFGRLLMTRLIEYARSRGIVELFGDILAENHAMLALSGELGFSLAPASAGVVRAARALSGSL
jgi:acetyltransferase